MLNAKVSLSSGHDKKDVGEQTLQEVYDQMSSDLATSQPNNNILDLQFAWDEATG